MDVFVTREEYRFVWDSDKAASNFLKHGISFDRAIEVFFDPLHELVDASVDDEIRQAAIGLDFHRHVLFVVNLVMEGDTIRIISARLATRGELKIYENA